MIQYMLDVNYFGEIFTDVEYCYFKMEVQSWSEHISQRSVSVLWNTGFAKECPQEMDVRSWHAAAVRAEQGSATKMAGAAILKSY